MTFKRHTSTNRLGLRNSRVDDFEGQSPLGWIGCHETPSLLLSIHRASIALMRWFLTRRESDDNSLGAKGVSAEKPGQKVGKHRVIVMYFPTLF